MNILTAKLGKMCISKHQIFISTLDSQHSIQLYTLYTCPKMIISIYNLKRSINKQRATTEKGED